MFIFHDNEEDKFMKKYFYDSFVAPGSVENKKLLEESGEISSNVVEVFGFSDLE